ncbi:hypothetical protein [Mesorhizobium sp. M0058]|uniref:hypothetical protein n=1 Tax=Mesorhizobium sp. M0058 TaxID=2956865 RepID=UPI003338F4CB
MEVSGLVGSVSVEVRADLKPLDKGFDEAKWRAQAFDKQASGSFRNLGNEAALAGRAVEGSAMRAAGATDALGRSVTAAGSAYRSLVAIAGAAGLALGSAFAFAQFIRNTVDSEKAQTQLAAALRSTGNVAGQSVDGLNAHAAALQRITAYEDDAVTSSQALLLTFTKIRGDTFNKATDAILDMATAMKQDLQGATIMVGKALNDPILGVTALSRAGVQFTASQKEVIKSLVETGDVAGAQVLILKELENQFGGSAKAARETLGGALQALGNAWGNLFELGKGSTDPFRMSIEKLIVAINNPAFQHFIQMVGASLFDALTAVVNVTTVLADHVGLLGTAIQLLISYKLASWAVAGAEALYGLSVAVAAAEGSMSLLGIASGTAGAIVGAISWPVVAIAAVGFGVYKIYQSYQSAAETAKLYAEQQKMVNEAMGQSIDPTAKATDKVLEKARADFTAAGAMLQRAEAELEYRRMLQESVPSLEGAPDPLAGATARLAEARKNFDSLGRTLQALNIQAAAETKAAANTGVEAISSATSLFNLAKDGFGDVASGMPKIGQAAGGVLGDVQNAAGVVMSATDAMQRANQANLETLLGYNAELRNTTTELAAWEKAIKGATSAGSIADFFGDTSDIANAQQLLDGAANSVDRLFESFRAGGQTVQSVGDNIEMVRASLIQQGFGEAAVNKFIDALITAQLQTDKLKANAKDLNSTIQGIKDKTVTITVVTRQVGSGTQSLYNVPNSSGGLSTVGVTRMGGGAGPSLSASSVPRTGYGSMGGYGEPGNTSVGVTRFSSTDRQVSSTPIYNTSTNSWGYVQPTSYQDPALLARANAMYPARAAGGPISPNTPYWVGEHGPELVMPQSAGTVVPNAQSVALASAQSGFTGREATREQDRMWTVLMNIEANTRKTFEGVEKWGASSSYSGSGSGGGSSYGGGASSSGADTDPLHAAYLKALATAKSNAQNVSGIIGYGAQGLSATPQQIAHRAVYGFSTGGIMGPGNGDTEKVELFKSPDERVIIARPDQFEDRRSDPTAAGDDREINIYFSQTIRSDGAEPSRDSQAELRRQTALGLQDALGSLRGR